ncbi:MAG: hypothetical protein R6T92_01365 [Desulfosalsimonadaceae bacterium]
MVTDDRQNMDEGKIREIVANHAQSGELACKQAFAAAKTLGTNPSVIGQYADEMGLRLVACQLGLFGYRPEKKIVAPVHPVNMHLAAAIEKHLLGGKLPCSAAFEIAEKMSLKKMDVSGACEAMDIKIKPCQLGAF